MHTDELSPSRIIQHGIRTWAMKSTVIESLSRFDLHVYRFSSSQTKSEFLSSLNEAYDAVKMKNIENLSNLN